MSVREEPDTLFILATPDEVRSEDIERLFRVFVKHQVVILPVGGKDILKMERWAKQGNLNACLVWLYLLASRVTSRRRDALWAIQASRGAADGGNAPKAGWAE